MKCFNCGKKFDYEKYYGICPKCGCFNKEETAQEQHQRYHDEYDNGYQHSEQVHTVSSYVQVRETKKISSRGSTIFLIVSILIFLTVVFGLTAFAFLYSQGQEKSLQREVVESEADHRTHTTGESFSFQAMTLTVEEAWVVGEGYKTDEGLAKGKKLVAVRLLGESDGEWSDENELSDAYIRHDGFCYLQIPSYEAFDYEELYGIELFGKYALCGARECEGCLVFWLDEDAEEFTLCLEEREGENLAFIRTIHSIEIKLEEEKADESYGEGN
ncbi:MAG: hypothetical protein HFI29_01725 [Lachnospiraceae bacterium]|jgi:hypothetical protein|nr:hypothetical protein [Lachnospiraceae bacterium]